MTATLLQFIGTLGFAVAGAATLVIFCVLIVGAALEIRRLW